MHPIARALALGLLACFLAASAAAREPVTAPVVQPWGLPAPAGAAQPQLARAPDGDLLLSWVERRAGGGHRFRFARHDAAEGWSDPRTIAEGRDWFVNWADVPAMQALEDGSLWAHLLVKNGAATYAYDVRLFRSTDGGGTWQALGPVHDDGTPTEHGFVAMWPHARDTLGIAWLDGRRTAGGGHGAGQHGGHGGLAAAMTLRTALFDAKGKRGERELDASTCDCCNTDAAITARGPLLAYRDRAAGEIRDITVRRLEAAGWTAPAPVHADGWVMPGCPVNGPAVAAHGSQAWVAWYTEAGGRPRLRLARSDDAGDRFAPPVDVAEGAGLLGRVDLAVDAAAVWVAWLQEDQGRQSVWLAEFDRRSGAAGWRGPVAELSGRGRATGFPRLQLRAGQPHLAWTVVEGGEPALAGVRVVR